MGHLKTLPRIISHSKENIQLESDYFDQFKNKSFQEFWNLLGNPVKNEKEYGLFQYELDLLSDLEKEKHIWIKKATGLGITEFTLRWIAWQCLKDDYIKNSQKDVSVVIITGPRIELAITLMDRLKALFNYDFETKNTVCVLNGCRIECFPSHHLASARGLNPKIVFLDEADFFPPKEQIEARSISERYIAKSNPWIIMVSTPNNPGGLYDTMEREENSLYHRITMNYKIGLRDKMFTEEEMIQAKRSPTFEREYNLQYGVGSGNIFQGLDEIIEKYDIIMSHGQKILCCDPAYGSSKFGIVGLEKIDDLILVKEATQYERPSPSAMLDIIVEKAKSFGNTVLVDSAHPGLIRDLLDKGVTAREVVFSKELSNMTIESAQAVKEKRVRISPIFEDLIAQLRAVQFNEKGHPDKKELSFDLGDAFMMGVNHFKTSHLRIIRI